MLVDPPWCVSLLNDVPLELLFTALVAKARRDEQPQYFNFAFPLSLKVFERQIPSLPTFHCVTPCVKIFRSKLCLSLWTSSISVPDDRVSPVKTEWASVRPGGNFRSQRDALLRPAFDRRPFQARCKFISAWSRGQRGYIEGTARHKSQ